MRAFFCVSLSALVLAGPALASGPVWVIVPNAPAAASGASGPAVDQKRREIRRGRRLARRTAAKAARLEAVAATSPLLTVQLEAEQQAVQLQVAAQTATEHADALEGQVAELTARPPVAPLFAPATNAAGGPTPGLDAVAIAEQFLGVPYRWGGADPTGFDCSGLVMYAYAQMGVFLPHYAASQFETGTPVDVSELQPGDLVFFEPRSDGPGHVALFVAGDEIIEAPHTGDVVKFASLSNTAAALGYVGAVRPPEPLY
jgi:cell wall-associated NlpC family hydrolase